MPVMKAMNAKLEQYILNGKTDGYVEEVGPNTFKRVWYDQASAEAWVQAVATISQEKNLPLICHTIQQNSKESQK